MYKGNIIGKIIIEHPENIFQTHASSPPQGGVQ